jgi:hypothetical protein
MPPPSSEGLPLDLDAEDVDDETGEADPEWFLIPPWLAEALEESEDEARPEGYAAGFDEEKHPRKESGEGGGQFAEKGEGRSGTATLDEPEPEPDVKPQQTEQTLHGLSKHMTPDPAFLATLSKSDKRAVIAYASDSYEDINDCLRHENCTDKTKMDGESVDRIVRAHPNFPEPVNVYRGWQPKNAEKMLTSFESKVGGNEGVYLSGLTSTTTDPSVADSFSGGSGIILKIRTRQGLPIAGSLTTHPDEMEILLPHNAGYRVIAVQRHATIQGSRGDHSRAVVILERVL